jgi:selenium-binding protein 1
MSLFRPDPTFYPSPRQAMQAAPERLGYVGILNVGYGKPDGVAVVDLDSSSSRYGQVLHTVEFPGLGDEVHHFDRNACGSALCLSSAHPHLERRYLLVPTLRTSRIYVLDTKPDPTRPQLVKTVEASEVASRAGYGRLHTVHRGPDAI